jgi:hypothetical protein
MSSKPGAAHSDYEYLRSAMLEKENTESEHDVLVTTAITLCGSPYGLRVRSEAWDSRARESAQAPLCSIEGRWPNAQAISWPAFLFRHQVDMGRLVADSRRDLWADTLRAQKG